MEFRLDEAQVGLQDTVRRFCADRFPLDRVAEREGRPVDRAVWNELAGLGVLGLLAPESRGGSGLGAVEAAVVFEELGSYLATGPTLWSVLVAPLVDGVATGDRLVGGIDAWPPAPGVGTGDRATDQPDAGAAPAEAAAEPVVVEHAGELDSLAVLRPDGVFLLDRDDLPAPQPLTPLDPLTPVGRIDHVPAGDRVGDAEAAARLRLLGAVLSAAMLLGLSARALEVARSYALEREQFGVPIGSFQAIKHMLADMYVRMSLARSATYAGAAVVDDPGIGDPARTVGAAKLLAAEAAIANAGAAVQVLGGMGFTWAMLPHYLLKRAWVLEHAFGTADDHALAIGTAVGEEAEAAAMAGTRVG
jgi:alkylation response protein AidB-like acyl-CoA dehydrogenase